MNGNVAAPRSGRRVSLALAALIALAATAITLVVSPAPASASVGPGDDRLMMNPTGWWMYYNVDAETVTARLNEHGARLTDLRVNSASPLRFTATMVKNTGAYGFGWSWYPSLTESEVWAVIDQDHGRLISAVGYETVNGPRFAVVLVQNTGAYFKNSTWCSCKTPDDVGAKLTANKARLIHLSTFGSGDARRWVAVMLENTGSDFYYWGWWLGVPASGVPALLNPGDRIIDMEANPDGTLNLIAYHFEGGTGFWSWYPGQSGSSLLDIAQQHGMRLISVSPNGGGNGYAALLVDNLDGLAAQLRNTYEGVITSGNYGYRLERDNGQVVADLQSDKVYEPASTIKLWFHLHVHRMIRLKHDDPLTNLWYYGGDDCAAEHDGTNITWLDTADQKMMIDSDNAMTVAITNHYDDPGSGKPHISDTGSAVHLSPQTRYLHCGGIGNRQTTLRDMGKIWFGAFGPKALLDSDSQDRFRTWMLSDLNLTAPLCMDSFNGTSVVSSIVREEVNALGKSAGTLEGFCDAMQFMVKGGDLTIGSESTWAMTTLTGVPVRSGGNTVLNYYHYSAFVDRMTTTPGAQAAAADVSWNNYREGMRQVIHDALLTWPS